MMPWRTSSLFLLAALIPACSGGTVHTAEDQAPTAMINSPADGATLTQGAPAQLMGTVEDDGSMDQLTVTWTVGGASACTAGHPDDNGQTQCSIVLDPDDTEITLSVADGAGNVGSDTVNITVNATGSPTSTITSPTPDGHYYSDSLVTFTANFADAETPAEDLNLTWESSLDGELTLPDHPDSSGVASGAVALSEGDHSITVTATDGDSKTGTANVTIHVSGPNLQPSCAILEPESGSAGAPDISVDFVAQVDDEHIPTLDVAWSSDQDGDLGTSTPDSDGGVSFSYADLTPTTHTITLTVTDEGGEVCTDSILYSVGTPPSITVAEPVSGMVYNENETLTFEALVADDGALSETYVTWTSDLDGDFHGGAPDTDGGIIFTDTLSVGTHNILVTVTDEDGLYATELISDVTINGLPTAPGIAISPATPNGDDTLTANITSPSTDPEGQTVNYEYDWLRNNQPTGISTNTVPGSATAYGETWRVIVTPNDIHGSGTVAWAEVTIGNTPPVVSDVTLSPNPVYTNDTLVCGATSTDAENQTVTYTYAWTVNGNAVAPTTSTLDGNTYFSKNNTVVCVVTPNDGLTSGATLSANIVVANAPPSINTVTLSNESPFTDDTLTATPTGWTDADGDSSSYTYQWYVNDVAVASGGTNPSLPGTKFDKGDEVYVRVTPTDGTTSGTPVQSNTATVVNRAPSLTGLTLAPLSPITTDTLTATPNGFSDADGDTAVYTFDWYVNGAGTPVQSGATATLSGSFFAKGDTILVVCTPSDGTASGVPKASQQATVLNSAPAITSASITPASPKTDSTLTAVANGWSDLDGDSPAYTYQWYVDGVALGGATASTLAGTNFNRGQTVYVRVTPNDGLAGTTQQSPTVTIGNTLPSISSVSLNITNPTVNDTLIATPVGWTDPDGDGPQYAYQWYVNEVAVNGATTSSLAPSNFTANDSVKVRVTPSDTCGLGCGNGIPVDSVPVTVGNGVPTFTNVSLNTTSPSEVLAPVATPAGYSDPDGDLEGTHVFKWFKKVGGAGSWTEIVGQTTNTLGASYYAKTDALKVEAYPVDSKGGVGPAVTSATATVVNSPPSVSSIAITPSSPTKGASPTASLVGYTDPDGDPTGTPSFTWYRKIGGVGSWIAVGTDNASLSNGYYDRGDTLYVQVIPRDNAALAGSTVDSGIVTVGNAAPSATSVSLSPTNPTRALGAIVATVNGYYDIEGDAAGTHTYAWYKQIGGAGAAVPTGTNASSLATNYFAKTDVVYVVVTPKDSLGASGSNVTSGNVTVGNSAPSAGTLALNTYTPAEGSTLTATPTVTDLDGDSLSYTYTWYLQNEGSGSFAAISGQTTANLADGGTSLFDRDDKIYAVAAAFDGAASTNTSQSPTATVSSTPPVAGTVSLSTLNPVEGSTLTATPSGFSDPDGDALSYTYTWSVQNEGSGSFVTIVGQTGPSINDTTLCGGASCFDKGDKVQVVANASDGGTPVSSPASSPATVGNTQPTNGTVAFNTYTPVEGGTLTATPTFTDVDGDALTYTYTWYLQDEGTGSWNTISGQTGSSLNDTTLCGGVSCFDKADAITAIAQAKDDSGVWVSSSISASAIVGNAAPSVGTVSLNTYAPVEGGTLTATGSATDPDGDSITFTYTWYLQNEGSGSFVAIAGQTGASLNDTALCGGVSCFDKADVLYAVAIAKDSSNATTNTSPSSNATVGNTVPVVSAVSVGGAPLYKNSTATSSYTASDVDGDALTITYQWYEGTAAGFSMPGTVVTSATAATLNINSFAQLVKGDYVKVRVTATETVGGGSGYGDASTGVLINNSAPVVGTVAISSSTVSGRTFVELATLTATPSGFIDADGDTLTYTYSWSADNEGNNSFVNVGSAQTLVDTNDGSSKFDKADKVKVVAYATDSAGATSSTSTNNNTVTIGNTLPTATYTNNCCSATEGSSPALLTTPTGDVDGDTVSVAIQWHKGTSSMFAVSGGTVINGATSATLANTYYAKGDYLRATVTPNDGTEDGAAALTNSWLVNNTAPVVSSVSVTGGPLYKTSVASVSYTVSDVDDADSAPVITYQWYEGTSAGFAMPGTTVTGATGSTIAINSYAQLAKGDYIKVRVTAVDTSSASATGDAATGVVINNSAPVTGTVAISSNTTTVGGATSSFVEDTTLTATPASFSDADGDSLTYTYTWSLQNEGTGSFATISGQTDNTLNDATDECSGSCFDRADKLKVTAVASDGTTSSGTSPDSTIQTIGNTLPTISSYSETSGFTCTEVNPPNVSSVTSADADGDTVTRTLQWHKSTSSGFSPGVGNTVGSTSTTYPNTLSSTLFAKGDYVKAVITANDGTENGGSITTAQYSIVNAAPNNPAGTTSLTSSAIEGQHDLLCTPPGSLPTDPDGDTVTWDFAWYVHSTAEGTGSLKTKTYTNDTFNRLYTLGDDMIRCDVRATDGAGGYSSTFASNTTWVRPDDCAGITVGVLPGYAAGGVAHPTLDTNSPLYSGATNWSTLGTCPVTITAIYADASGSTPTISTIPASVDVLYGPEIGYATAYTTTEKNAITSFVNNKTGGLIVSGRLWQTTNQSSLGDIVGVKAATFASGYTSNASVYTAAPVGGNDAHTVLQNLIANRVTGDGGYQTKAATCTNWASMDGPTGNCLTGVQIAGTGTGNNVNPIIVRGTGDATDGRGMFAGASMEYADTASSRQLIYNSLLWGSFMDGTAYTYYDNDSNADRYPYTDGTVFDWPNEIDAIKITVPMGVITKASGIGVYLAPGSTGTFGVALFSDSSGPATRLATSSALVTPSSIASGDPGVRQEVNFTTPYTIDTSNGAINYWIVVKSYGTVKYNSRAGYSGTLGYKADATSTWPLSTPQSGFGTGWTPGTSPDFYLITRK